LTPVKSCRILEGAGPHRAGPEQGTARMCNCTSHVHTFVCYLRNIAVDANRAAMGSGSARNAR